MGFEPTRGVYEAGAQTAAPSMRRTQSREIITISFTLKCLLFFCIDICVLWNSSTVLHFVPVLLVVLQYYLVAVLVLVVRTVPVRLIRIAAITRQ